MDNITFGSGATREQVLEAARAAQVGASTLVWRGSQQRGGGCGLSGT